MFKANKLLSVLILVCLIGSLLVTACSDGQLSLNLDIGGGNAESDTQGNFNLLIGVILIAALVLVAVSFLRPR